jgi:Leucine Rich repeat
MDEKPKTTEPPVKSRRRWYQYSLRTLLIGIVVLSLPCCWLGMKVREARQQAAAVAAIQKLGGDVLYDYEFDAQGDFVRNAALPGPKWLHSLLGDDFFDNVFLVELQGAHRAVTDADLEHLKAFTKLSVLDLGYSQVTNAGVERLKGLTQLKTLFLNNTQVTDAGLKYLAQLTQLEDLHLAQTQVTDAGLEYLKGLTCLKTELDLSFTQVTDAGVAKLQQALPNCNIIH